MTQSSWYGRRRWRNCPARTPENANATTAATIGKTHMARRISGISGAHLAPHL